MILRNSKPKVKKLNEIQVKRLIELGFKHNSLFSNDNEITTDTSTFEKSYDCCGGSFDLFVRIGDEYYFNDCLIQPEVKIATPYDSWWCEKWTLRDFTNSMEKFENDLQNDIRELRKLGIIS